MDLANFVSTRFILSSLVLLFIFSLKILDFFFIVFWMKYVNEQGLFFKA